jgi:hypothetical protein
MYSTLKSGYDSFTFMSVALKSSLAVLFSLGILFPEIQVVFGQVIESRKEELIRLRQEKAQQTVPEDKIPGVEKMLLRFESGNRRQTFQIRYKDFYPRIGAPEEGAGFGGGIRYFKQDIASSGLTVESQALWSLRDYRVAEFQFGRFTEIAPVTFMSPRKFHAPFEFIPETPWQIGRPRAFLYGDFKYHYFPQMSYYGLGSDSSLEDETKYLYQRLSGEVLAGYEFSEWFAGAIKTGYLDFKAGSGTADDIPSVEDRFDDSSAPGLGSRHDFYRFSVAAFANYQDDVSNPHKGGIVGIFYTLVQQLDGNEFDFEWWAVDARHFIPLGSRQRTLALRLAASQVESHKGGRVPFYLMPTLGGTQTLRGFRHNRFRDSNLVYGSLEYRWEPAPAFQLALFYDVGKAYGIGEPLTFNSLETNYGFGIRFRTEKQVIIRIDFAFGGEGSRTILRSGEAF